MPKKPQTGKKRGRDQVIKDDDGLLRRYGALTLCLEHNWGGIGLKVERVRKPADVSSALKLVPGIEWCAPFRDHKASCLANAGSGPLRFQELRIPQQMHDDAIKAQHDQWSSFHSFAQTFEKAKTSLRIAVSELGSLASFFPIFYFVFAIDSCVQE